MGTWQAVTNARETNPAVKLLSQSYIRSKLFRGEHFKFIVLNQSKTSKWAADTGFEQRCALEEPNHCSLLLSCLHVKPIPRTLKAVELCYIFIKINLVPGENIKSILLFSILLHKRKTTIEIQVNNFPKHMTQEQQRVTICRTTSHQLAVLGPKIVPIENHMSK